MKKITLLLFLLTAYFGYAQPTTDPTAPPARNTEDVISIYGGGNGGNPYSNITSINYSPNWSQPAPWNAPDPAVDTGSGNLVMFYDELSYQGTDFTGNAQNASAMEFLHVDIWTPNAETINVSPINNGPGGTGSTEVQVGITTTAGAWTSIDIPKSSFAGMTWDAVGQFIFVRPGYGSPTPRANVYLDNIYFWKAPISPEEDATLSDLTVDGTTVSGFSSGTVDYTYALSAGTTVAPPIDATPTNAGASTILTQASGVPGDATVVVTAANGTTMRTYTVSFIALGPAMAAPTPPARAVSDVISIFSDAYTAAVGPLVYTDNGGSNMNTFNTNWCGANTELVSVDGNDTNKITGLGCEGIDWQGSRTIDATEMTHFHMDFYTDETDFVGKVFTLKFSQWSDDDNTNDPDNAERSAFILNLEGVAFPNKPAIQNGWNSVDVVIDDAFTGNLRRDDIVQFIISSNLSGDVWYDNLYLYKGVPLSNNDFTKASFRTYPNPTQNSWTIKTDNIKMETIEVFDILGKEVLRLSPNTTQATIDASVLKAGIYFAQIKTLSGINSVKLIKQ